MSYLGPKHFRVLASGTRKERLEAEGVTINRVHYHFPVLSPEEEGDIADLIIIAVKDTALKTVIAEIKNQVGPDTLILPILNGVDSEEQVAATYGWEHVLYAYMRVSSIMKDGVAEYDPNFGEVHFGEAKNENLSEHVLRIKALFDDCGISYKIDPDMVRGLWYKFMCNVGENQTCALLGIPFGVFQLSDHANFIRREAMREVVAIASRLHIDLSEADIERQEATIMRLPFYNKPSTLQDIENGKKTEIEMFAGKVVRLGEELGVETPLNRLFYHAIKVYEEKNEGKFRGSAVKNSNI
jgi:2-dehydropantoate 2-reductase